MAIVRVEGKTKLERRVGLTSAKKVAKKAAKKGGKKAAKKGAKHAIEKHAAKKHPAKKHAEEHAEKHAGKKAAKQAGEAAKRHTMKEPDSGKLIKAFHHLQRAAAVISLVEKPAGGDLHALLELGKTAYERAAAAGVSGKLTKQAQPLAKAIEHLALAGLYSARLEFRVAVVEPVGNKMVKRLRDLRPRLEDLGMPENDTAQNLLGVAWELLRRADAAGDDAQLEWELGMAADSLCEALEEGL